MRHTKVLVEDDQFWLICKNDESMGYYGSPGSAGWYVCEYSGRCITAGLQSKREALYVALVRLAKDLAA